MSDYEIPCNGRLSLPALPPSLRRATLTQAEMAALIAEALRAKRTRFAFTRRYA